MAYGKLLVRFSILYVLVRPYLWLMLMVCFSFSL
jgi:hypothetical protein